MWCDLGKSSINIALTGLVVASIVVPDTVFAAHRHRSYNTQEFRAALKGLGYNVKAGSDPLTDPKTVKEISKFQKGYKLTVDGKANPETEKHTALIVKILQGNLNLVLKPSTPLPRDRFYGNSVEELVKEYQKKNQLPETGIADLALRQKLDQEAKTILANSATSDSSTTTKPKTKPTPKPTPKSMSKPTPKSMSKPTPKSMSKPMANPTPSPTSQP